jgi:hypothetical protein
VAKNKFTYILNNAVKKIKSIIPNFIDNEGFSYSPLGNVAFFARSLVFGEVSWQSGLGGCLMRLSS